MCTDIAFETVGKIYANFFLDAISRTWQNEKFIRCIEFSSCSSCLLSFVSLFINICLTHILMEYYFGFTYNNSYQYTPLTVNTDLWASSSWYMITELNTGEPCTSNLSCFLNRHFWPFYLWVLMHDFRELLQCCIKVHYLPVFIIQNFVFWCFFFSQMLAHC